MNANMELLNKAEQKLKSHGFTVMRFATGEEAAQWILSQVEPGKLAGVGGSLTLRNLHLPERMAEKGLRVLDHWVLETKEEKMQIFREAIDADYYFSSANAISADGFILNTDGNCNRIAMTVFGPKHLYILAGSNKITPDVASAFDRIQEIAPDICRRNNFATPCVKTGKCIDCNSPDRSCRAYLLLRNPSRTVPTTVILVEESLGL